MMKVVQVIGSLTYGGAEKMIINYYNSLNHEDIKMDFIVHAKGNEVYDSIILNNNDHIYYVQTPGKIGPFRYISAIKRILNENGPYDVIHTHTNTQEWMPLLAAKLAHVPMRISHSHNTYFNTSKFQILFNRFIINRISTLRLACGKDAGNSFYGSNAKFLILRNAIDVSEFCKEALENRSKNRKEYNIKDDEIIIGHIGRFVKQKNHFFLIDAFEKACAANDKIKLLLFGDGKLFDSVVDYCKKKQINDKVIFAGTEANVSKAYSVFDIFVLPSIHEGLPLTLVEAQCSGLKVLASDRITRECDLGLGFIKYLPLDLKLWAEELKNVGIRADVDYESIARHAIEYDSKHSVKTLIDYYNGFFN